MEGGEFSSLMKIKLIANIVLLRAVCPGEMMKQWMKHHHRFQVGGTCPKCQRHFSRCFWGLETYMLNEVWRSSPQRRHLGDVQRPILAAPPPKSSLKGVVMMKQTTPFREIRGFGTEMSKAKALTNEDIPNYPSWEYVDLHIRRLLPIQTHWWFCASSDVYIDIVHVNNT